MNKASTYPGLQPGKATAQVTDTEARLANNVIGLEWRIVNGCIRRIEALNRHTGQKTRIEAGCLPRLVLGDGRAVDLAAMQPERSPRAGAGDISALFRDGPSGLAMQCSATLDDGANAVIVTIEITASSPTEIREIVFVDATLPGARRVGEVDGSVVVCGDVFLAVEHPLAKNLTDANGHVRCSLLLESALAAGQTRICTLVVGVTPPGQLRRGFLHYLEQRRVHPYRQFLHYNNWYDVVLARPVERMTEPECLETIEYYGRELVEKRGVKLDAFVWDDGWDDFDTLWDFHKGFPNGFRNLVSAAQKYGADQGVWMSPNGGYARAKDARIAHGKPLGYETNANGFAMGGPRYRSAFRDVCLKMIRENGVVFFKFDGMGEGGETSGTTGELSDDIHAILELSRELHEERADLYVSATCGTWASPFWLLYADSVWRQGGDSGHHGEGDTRQQWITYRDMFCYERVVQAGPLYPLNSLMLHGILIGNRPNRAPGGMVLDEKSVADEIWTFFGSGTGLQELYVSPGVPTDTMLEQLARAAKWARANADTLIDTHWVGGNPGKKDVYGWASWRPGKGILVLRNPSETAASFSLSPGEALELPDDAADRFRLSVMYPERRNLPVGAVPGSRSIEWQLAPFEVVVMELSNDGD